MSSDKPSSEKPSSDQTSPSVEIKTIILQVLGNIPEGKVITYGGVATLAGVPRHARYVGNILKKLPNGSKIPWHRVLNGKGEISFPEGSDRWQLQRHKLAQEGVIMVGSKVSLKHYLWRP